MLLISDSWNVLLIFSSFVATTAVSNVVNTNVSKATRTNRRMQEIRFFKQTVLNLLSLQVRYYIAFDLRGRYQSNYSPSKTIYH